VIYSDPNGYRSASAQRPANQQYIAIIDNPSAAQNTMPPPAQVPTTASNAGTRANAPAAAAKQPIQAEKSNADKIIETQLQGTYY